MTENGAMMTFLLSVHAVELIAERSELGRCQALALAEKANKMGGIAETAACANLFYGKFSEVQQFLSVVDAHMDQAGGEAATNIPAEQTG